MGPDKVKGVIEESKRLRESDRLTIISLVLVASIVATAVSAWMFGTTTGCSVVPNSLYEAGEINKEDAVDIRNECLIKMWADIFSW